MSVFDKRDSLVDAIRKAEDAKRVVGAVSARQQQTLAQRQGFGRVGDPAGGPDVITFQGRPLEDAPAPPPLGSGVRSPDVDIDPRTRLQFQIAMANRALRRKAETPIKREDRLFGEGVRAGGTEFTAETDPTGRFQAQAELAATGGAGSLQEAQRVERELADINAELRTLEPRVGATFGRADARAEARALGEPLSPAAPPVGAPSAGVISQPPVAAEPFGPSGDPTLSALGDKVKGDFLRQRAAKLQTELDRAKAGPAYTAKTPEGRAVQALAGDDPELQGFARRMDAATDFKEREVVWSALNKARAERSKNKSTREREEEKARVVAAKDLRDHAESIRQFNAKQATTKSTTERAIATGDQAKIVSARETELNQIRSELDTVRSRLKNATLDAQQVETITDKQGSSIQQLTFGAKQAAKRLAPLQARELKLLSLEQEASKALADAQRGTSTTPTPQAVEGSEVDFEAIKKQLRDAVATGLDTRAFLSTIPENDLTDEQFAELDAIIKGTK